MRHLRDNSIIWYIVCAILFAIVLAIALTSCNMQKYCSERFPPQVRHDSSTVTVIERHDSIIRFPADSSWLAMLADCDSIGQIYFKQIQGYEAGKTVKVPLATVHNNVIYMKCISDTNRIGIWWYNKYVRTNVKAVSVSTRIEYKSKWYQVWAAYGFLILLTYEIIRLLPLLLKNIIKLNIVWP